MPPRNPTFMRRRQERLQAEEAQRAFNRQQREHVATVAQAVAQQYAALHAAALAGCMGQALPKPH